MVSIRDHRTGRGARNPKVRKGGSSVVRTTLVHKDGRRKLRRKLREDEEQQSVASYLKEREGS